MLRRCVMPRGDKSAYSEKQKRQARHIEEGYEHRGVSEKEAEKRAWATVNKTSGGGKKSESHGKKDNWSVYLPPARPVARPLPRVPNRRDRHLRARPRIHEPAGRSTDGVHGDHKRRFSVPAMR